LFYDVEWNAPVQMPLFYPASRFRQRPDPTPEQVEQLDGFISVAKPILVGDEVLQLEDNEPFRMPIADPRLLYGQRVLVTRLSPSQATEANS
jgi:hypothetical protein